MIIKSVTFFGGADCLAGSENYIAAKETAKLIAKTGRTIVNGGGPGVMLAATSGAKEVGGKTTVVYYNPELATTFEGVNPENLADSHFVEENYVDRTQKLLELGDTYVIFNGATGTLSEFGMAWGVARLYFGHHRPLILFGDFWHELIADFKKYMLIRSEAFEVMTIVNTPEEALIALEKYENIIERNRHENHSECKGGECDLIL